MGKEREWYADGVVKTVNTSGAEILKMPSTFRNVYRSICIIKEKCSVSLLLYKGRINFLMSVAELV